MAKVLEKTGPNEGVVIKKRRLDDGDPALETAHGHSPLVLHRTRHRFVEAGEPFSSWLNMAEVEISVLTEQCLDRRMGSQVIVANEIGAWESERNAARATIDWRFTIPNAVRKDQAR